jgi:hypothetical protein
MKNQRINLQSAVAMLFIFILVAVAVTTVFGQEKKERTKIVQLKITENENGEVKSIDTTYVFNQDKDFDFDFGTSFDVDMEQMGDSIKLFLTMDDGNIKMMNMDSIMQQITVKLDDFENGHRMMFISHELDDIMEEMDEHMKSFSYNFNQVMTDGDSTMKVIVRTRVDNGDTLVEKTIKNFGGDGEEKNIFIFSDGEEIKIDEDGEVKVIKLGGDHGASWTGDTIIEKDGAKIIIKTKKDGDEAEQTIEYISVITDEDTDVDTEIEKEIMIIKKGDAQNVWVDSDHEVYVLDDAKYEFLPAEENDLESLKDVGVKTKNRSLDVENLKFSPNPNNGKFNLSFTLKEKKKVTINIYDINGNVVYSETLKEFQGDYSKEIDISDQESGTFFLQIVQGLYDIIKKIIIQ